MRKFLATVGIFVIILSLIGCGGGRPNNTGEAMYQIGLNSLQTADDYINGKITGETAVLRFEEYTKQADAQYEKNCDDLGVDALGETELSNDGIINLRISFLSYEVFDSERGTGSISDVINSRNELAKALGK